MDELERGLEQGLGELFGGAREGGQGMPGAEGISGVPDGVTPEGVIGDWLTGSGNIARDLGIPYGGTTDPFGGAADPYAPITDPFGGLGDLFGGGDSSSDGSNWGTESGDSKGWGSDGDSKGWGSDSGGWGSDGGYSDGAGGGDAWSSGGGGDYSDSSSGV